MSKQKKEYDLFNQDILKVIDQFENEYDVLISEKMKAQGIKMDDHLPNLNDLSEDIKRLNQSGELKGNKELENLMDITMNLPEVMKSMTQMLQSVDQYLHKIPKSQ